MYFEDNYIRGYRDKIDAMKQVIYKILNTERFQYVIYSWNYGIELADLYGEPISYVCPELERRIIEALVQDNRIESVNNFIFSLELRNTIYVTFVVKTIYGDIDSDYELYIG